MKITVVSPHRGDAAFALGLTIAIWLKDGHTVEVVNCFTRSEFAPYSDVQSLHENDRMSFATAVRKREDEAWGKLYGTAKFKLTDLNLKDAPARLHCKQEEVFGRAADVSEKVVSKIHRAVQLSKAAAVVLPLGLGGHVDHLSAREAALSAVAVTNPLAFYEELPFALHTTSEMEEATLRQLAQTLGTDLRLTFPTAKQELMIDNAVLERRRIALCYDSQIDETATTNIAEFCRRHGGRERLWSNVAWRAQVELTSSSI